MNSGALLSVFFRLQPAGLVLLSLFFIQLSTTAHSSDCLRQQVGEPVQILRVTDGDTVVLTDQRRVRIIGINAPELRTRAGHQQAFAHAAKTALEKLLDSHSTVRLYPGIEPQDRYGRWLAHIRLDQDTDVSEYLLKSGLSAHIAVAPNTRCAEQHAQWEQQARAAAQGLWKNRHSWLVSDASLHSLDAGFRLVQSRVTSLHTENRKPTIRLENGLQIRLSSRLVKSMALQALLGQHVEVRGWISHQQGSYYLTLHHAVNLQRLN